MGFQLPHYHEPNFEALALNDKPDARWQIVDKDGVAPEFFHSTSMFPEYYKLDGRWILAEESRMDCCSVYRSEEARVDIIEARNLRVGDKVILGRTENGEDGIFVWTEGFMSEEEKQEDKFVFRASQSRETASSHEYDFLYELLDHEREHGNILWVLGPAFAFDYDSRDAMRSLQDHGYVQGLMAGNALATHDLEAGLLGTGLGQDIYNHRSMPNGHYNHLDVINKVRSCGSIPNFVNEYDIKTGIMSGCVKNDIPFVLCGSIRDDGPLPEVIGNVYEGQANMREMVRKATTIICMATQLHTIATGNMTPCFRKREGQIRPLYFYSVDIAEFALNKLVDRGSLAVKTFCTNVQDFIVNVSRGVKP